MESKIFPATLSSLDEIMEYFRDVFKKVSLSEKEKKKFELALEEAVVNIIHYAYQTPDGKLEVSCKYHPDTGYLIAKIKDSGRPFNPLNASKIETPKGLEIQPVGGLGIHFMKELVDVIEYAYIDGENILTLHKKSH